MIGPHDARNLLLILLFFEVSSYVEVRSLTAKLKVYQPELTDNWHTTLASAVAMQIAAIRSVRTLIEIGLAICLAGWIGWL